MKIQLEMPCPRLVASCIFVGLLLSSCTALPESCPAYTPILLTEMAAYSGNPALPFQFPLDPSGADDTLYFGWFGVNNWFDSGPFPWNKPVQKFHAAEDYRRPAGTPVYAMADGQISFSGRAGGYGWLIIIDHPQANLYSLYGHLSPSRWRLMSGAVEKGELIAYLGDSDENGGSSQQPLEPHLHFGIRAGQRADYPGRGEWRFMAGWIKFCPQDLGWLQPSAIISNQDIPDRGFPPPAAGFLQLWGSELLITLIYALGGVGWLFSSLRKKLPLFLVSPGIIVTAAGIVFHNNGMVRTYILLGIGIFLLMAGIYLCIQRYRQQKRR